MMAGALIAAVNYPTIGALIGVSFAFGWAVAGSLQLSHPGARRLALAASALVSLILATALLQRPREPLPSTGAHFDGPGYGIAVGFESCAIPVAVVFCRRRARPDLLLPTVAGIVGLHFFGLAYALREVGSVFVWTGAAMTALAALSFCCARPAHARRWAAAVGFGSALILWVSAWSVLW